MPGLSEGDPGRRHLHCVSRNKYFAVTAMFATQQEASECSVPISSFSKTRLTHSDYITGSDSTGATDTLPLRLGGTSATPHQLSGNAIGDRLLLSTAVRLSIMLL